MSKKIDAEEFYRKGLRPHKCGEVSHAFLEHKSHSPIGLGCKAPAAHRYRVFWPFKELISRWPTAVALISASSPDGKFPTVRFKDGQDWAAVTITYACDTCKGTIERALAKAPSWVLVEKENRPDMRKFVQVPGEPARGPEGGEVVKSPAVIGSPVGMVQ